MLTLKKNVSCAEVNAKFKKKLCYLKQGVSVIILHCLHPKLFTHQIKHLEKLYNIYHLLPR